MRSWLPFQKKKQFYEVIKFSYFRALDEVESVEEIPKVVVIVDLFETAVEDRQVLHAGSANLVVFLKFLKKNLTRNILVPYHRRLGTSSICSTSLIWKMSK